MRRLAELGLYGEDIEGYGCPGMSPLARGLVNMELHRGDGSLGTFLGVQSGLAMKSIALLGSEEQKERWLPAMARLDAIGAFALTEPAHGSDSRRAGDERAPRRRRLGARRRQALDRQRLDRRRRRRLGALRRGRPGQGLPRRDGHARASRPTTMAGKGASRAIWQADIRARRRARPESVAAARRRAAFKDAGRVLVTTRTTCAWGALGHAVAAYDAALTYSKQRTQFGKPLCRFQIVQERLVQDARRGHEHAALLHAARAPGGGRAG